MNLQETEEEIHIAFKIDGLVFVPKVLLHCHFYYIAPNFENEFVLNFLSVRDAFSPHLFEYVWAYEKFGIDLFLEVLLFQLVVDLISDNAWCILNNFEWLVFGTTVSQELPRLNFKVHKFWDLQLGEVVDTIHAFLQKAMLNHLQLVRLVKDGELFKVVEIGKHAVDAEDALVHSLD